MNKMTKRIYFYLILTLKISLLAHCPLLLADDDDDDDDVPLSVISKDGLQYVHLSQERQEISGIETTMLETLHYQEEMLAFATVLSTSDLVSMKHDYELLAAEVAIAENNYQHAEINYQKLKQLHQKTQNVQSTKLRETKAQRDLQLSILNKQKLKYQTHRQFMTQVWGEEIANIALSGNSTLYDEFVQFKKSLLLLSLKPTQVMPKGVEQVFVGRDTNRFSARDAKVLSISNKMEMTTQGETFYLETDSAQLRPGMRLYVWIPVDSNIKWGVNISDDALVWHAGKLWAYVKTEDDLFLRKALIEPIDTGEGWFVTANFRPGDEVVVEGAQLLLSEETRNTIPDEDDDP